MTTTNTANAAITTQDILKITPKNGDLKLLVDREVFHVVGLDAKRNVVFLNKDYRGVAENTFEICLDDYPSIKELKGSIVDSDYMLVPKQKLVNCTPHTLNIIVGDKIVDIAPSGIVPRCSQSEQEIGTLDGIPITKQVFGEVVDLPEPKIETYYIVSRLVAAACRRVRDDLLIPGPLVRDDEGKVIGCKGLSRL